MAKLTSYAQATSLNTTDKVPLVQSAVNKWMYKNVLQRLVSSPWNELTSGTDFTAAPPNEKWNGSTFSSVSAWVANTAYSLGDIVRPTAANGFLYECVTAGTSHATTEPTWGTTLGAATADNTVSWRCIGAHVITTAADLTSHVKVGYALKYTWSGTTYYGIVIGISATRIAIAGARLNLGTNITALYYGLPSLVRVLDFHIAGAYAAAIQDCLNAAGNQAYQWQASRAYLVHWKFRNKTADSTTAPKMNPKTAGNVVSADDTAAGTQPSTSFVEHRYALVNTTNYDIDRGDAIELAAVAAGGTGDAANLSAMLTFVMEN